MTDQELKDLVASLAIESAKTDAQMKQLQQSQAKTDEEMKALQQLVKRVSLDVGNIGNSQGAVAEEFFYNTLKESKMIAGIHYDFIDKNLTRESEGVEDEFDILMINGKDVALIEVKYRAKQADLTKLLSKKYQNFKKLFPMYKDYTHHLVLASFSMYDDLKEKALANGVIVLQRKGDVIETFEPV